MKIVAEHRGVLRHRRYASSDAQDLVQAFFAHMTLHDGKAFWKSQQFF
jgi:hypothetical protein